MRQKIVQKVCDLNYNKYCSVINRVRIANINFLVIKYTMWDYLK